MIYFTEKVEIEKKSLADFGDYFELEWQLNKSPTLEWDKEFEKNIKKFLEKENPLFGPYKPKIINSILITTLDNKDDSEKQRDFFEKTFFEPINAKNLE